jgi:hypothetical protein
MSPTVVSPDASLSAICDAANPGAASNNPLVQLSATSGY